MATNLGIKDQSPNFNSKLEQLNGTNIWTINGGYDVTYLVMSDSLAEPLSAIISAVGLPFLGEVGIGSTTCIERNAKNRSSVINPSTGLRAELYEIEYKYDTKVPEGDQTGAPETKRPSIKWDVEVVKENVPVDLDGLFVGTINGEPLFIEEDVICPVLIVSRYERGAFNPAVQLAYINSTNSAVFYGAPIGTALMKTISATEESINQALYSMVEYHIIFKIRGTEQHTWKRRILHEGYLYKKNAADANAVVFTDGKGTKQRVNLKVSNGTKLGLTDPPEYIYRRTKGTQNFNGLYLGPY